MSDIYSILTDLGYSPKADKDGWRMASLYRQGDNETALKVYTDGWCQDFVTNERFNLETLIKRTLNVDDTKVAEYLKGQHIQIPQTQYKEKLKVPETFDPSILKELIPDYTYFEKRGISRKTCQLFKGGLCLGGTTIMAKLKDRQVLNIYDCKHKLIALTGRSIYDKHPKWKHIGSVTNSVFPAYLNHKIIKELREIILVESPVDVLRLWDVGIKNVISLFGVNCSYAILNYLLKANPDKIFISLNNEIDLNGGVGNQGAEKVYVRLKRYFDPNKIVIYLPPCKDFADVKCTVSMIEEWYKNRYEIVV